MKKIEKFFDFLLNWLRYNWGLKVISLMLSFLLWFYVTTVQTPKITKIFMVPLHYYGLNNELIILEKQKNYVDIHLKGPKRLVNQIDPSTLNVFLNLSRIVKQGTYEVEVNVSVPSGVNLVKVEPETVKLKIDKVFVKFYLITYTYIGKGEFKDSYSMTFTPNLIKVRGRKEDLMRLQYVTIFLTDNIFKRYKGEDKFLKLMKIYPIGDDGELIEGVKLEPNIIEVVFRKK